MISSLRGKVESFSATAAVINVGGIGFQVFLPTPTLSALATIGKEVQIYTHLQVREDSMTLYGFGAPEELALFQTLLGVSGIGPKLGLSMLSAMSVEQLTMSIATGNTELLATIPGIGKKLASRVVLELKEKVGAAWVSAPATGIGQENAEVLSALTALGYSAAESARALAALPADPKMSLEEKVRLALQQFGGRLKRRTMVREVICEPIELKGKLSRHEIVQKVVNTFINTEFRERGKGIRFYYPVEKLSNGSLLYLRRPGGLQKWNFDFKVDVKEEMGLGKGRHQDITADILNKKEENPEQFEKLVQAMTAVYGCSECDVNQVLNKYGDLQSSFKTGANVEILLKVLKWMFIMEDIVYWNYDGRAKLYNYLQEI
jgi:Holliday junction DNA helicase RuvA